ncbi:MAG TPA: hypothetical protein VHO70_24470 [Chitinispirillaceae bacterium]|nr:hypothetical protein [Chitinispirillaceae bacterium]
MKIPILVYAVCLCMALPTCADSLYLEKEYIVSTTTFGIVSIKDRSYIDWAQHERSFYANKYWSGTLESNLYLGKKR